MDSRETTWLGRYLAQKAIRNQSRADSDEAAVKSMATAPLGLTPAYMANEIVMNNVVQGRDENKAKRVLDKAHRKAEKRTWGQQFKHGLKKAPLWALTGGVGSGLVGYLISKYGDKGSDPQLTAINSAITGGLAGGAFPVAQALATKAMLSRTSRHDTERAKKLLSKHPNLASLPMGDVVGAAIPKN
jgi:hypothetical protein